MLRSYSEDLRVRLIAAVRAGCRCARQSRDSVLVSRRPNSPEKPIWGMPHMGLNRLSTKGNILKLDSSNEW